VSATKKNKIMTDLEFYAKLCAFESRLGVLEQMLLRLYTLMLQQHQQLRADGT
jgi:hypothetical protein